MNTAKIIEALSVIKKTCDDAGECTVCALGTDDGFCKVSEEIPATWEIVDSCIVRLMM